VSGLALLLIHAAATWGLVGLIWTVQLVQYPGLARVGAAELPAFHEHHCARITWIVGPLMACELATGLALLAWRPPAVPLQLVGSGLALIAVNWACTAFVSVPLHARLTARAPGVQRSLVATNWIRTAAWTARGGCALAMLRAAHGA